MQMCRISLCNAFAEVHTLMIVCILRNVQKGANDDTPAWKAGATRGGTARGMGASTGVAGGSGGDSPYPEFPAAIPSEDFKDVALHDFFLQLRQQVFHMLKFSFDCRKMGAREREGRTLRVRGRDSASKRELETEEREREQEHVTVCEREKERKSVSGRERQRAARVNIYTYIYTCIYI